MHGVLSPRSFRLLKHWFELGDFKGNPEKPVVGDEPRVQAVIRVTGVICLSNGNPRPFLALIT
jgi:hypothetical protein